MLPQHNAAQGVGMRSQSYAYRLGVVAILAGVAVLAFSRTPTDVTQELTHQM